MHILAHFPAGRKFLLGHLKERLADHTACCIEDGSRTLPTKLLLDLGKGSFD